MPNPPPFKMAMYLPELGLPFSAALPVAAEIGADSADRLIGRQSASDGGLVVQRVRYCTALRSCGNVNRIGFGAQGDICGAIERAREFCTR